MLCFVLLFGCIIVIVNRRNLSNLDLLQLFLFQWNTPEKLKWNWYGTAMIFVVWTKNKGGFILQVASNGEIDFFLCN